MPSSPSRQPLAAKNISVTAPVRQAKVSSTVPQDTSAPAWAFSGSAVSSRVPSQPMQTVSDVSAAPTALVMNDDTTSSAVEHMRSQTGTEAAASS